MRYFGRHNHRYTLVDVEGLVLASPMDELTINEPESYGDVNFSGKRSAKWRTFNNQVTDSKEVSLKFDNIKAEGEAVSALTLINQIMVLGGVDSSILIRAYRTPKNGVETYKEWLLMFDKSFEESDLVITTKVKRIDFNDKLRTRFSTDINTESSENLDGVADTPIVLTTMPLHSRRIHNTVISAASGFEDIPVPVTDDSRSIIEVSFGSPDTLEIDNYISPIDLELGDVAEEEIPDTVTTMIDLKYDGEIIFNVDSTVAFYLDALFNLQYTITLNFYIDIYDFSGEVNSHNLLDTATVSNIGQFQALALHVEEELTLQVLAKQRVYAYFELEYSSNSGAFSATANIDRQASSIDILYKTKVKTSLCEGVFVHDLVNKLAQKAIGDESYNPVRSTLMDTGGCAELNFITTGNKIRGLDRSLITSLDKVTSFIQARYNAGLSITREESSTYIDVERASNFFQDVKVLSLTNIENVVRRINTDLVFNSIKTGYTKYSNPDKEGSRDGFNTDRGYITPIEKHKMEMPLIANDIYLDGSEIERVKRLELKPIESDSADDVLFCIKCFKFDNTQPFKPSEYGDDVEVLAIVGTASTNKMKIVGLILHTLEVADMINISASDYDITAISLNYRDNSTTITVSSIVSDFISYSNFYFKDSVGVVKPIIMPERRDSFTTLEGVTDANTEYNADHAPSNFLFEWFEYIGGSLKAKADSEKIKVTSIKNNVSLTREYKGIFQTCSKISTSVTESDDIALSVLRASNPPFLAADLYEITCYTDYDDEYLKLENSMHGEDGETDYGYIEFPFKGETIKAYPIDFSHKKSDMETSIICWGKAV